MGPRHRRPHPRMDHHRNQEPGQGQRLCHGRAVHPDDRPLVHHIQRRRSVGSGSGRHVVRRGYRAERSDASVVGAADKRLHKGSRKTDGSSRLVVSRLWSCKLMDVHHRTRSSSARRNERHRRDHAQSRTRNRRTRYRSSRNCNYNVPGCLLGRRFE